MLAPPLKHSGHSRLPAFAFKTLEYSSLWNSDFRRRDRGVSYFLFFAGYCSSFWWLRTFWHRWLFWVLFFIVLGAIFPRGAVGGAIGAAGGFGHFLGLFIMCQVLRWTYLGAAEFIKTIWEAVRGVKEKPPTLDQTPRLSDLLSDK